MGTLITILVMGFMAFAMVGGYTFYEHCKKIYKKELGK